MYVIKQKQGKRFFRTLKAALKFKQLEEHEKKIRVDIYKRMATAGGYIYFEKI